jgi:excisionase family DNA binding protein
MRALKSIEEAAGLLGISKWTVRSYVRTGKLKPVRLGRRVLMEETELERFVAENRKVAEAECQDMCDGHEKVANAH